MVMILFLEFHICLLFRSAVDFGSTDRDVGPMHTLLRCLAMCAKCSLKLKSAHPISVWSPCLGASIGPDGLSHFLAFEHPTVPDLVKNGCYGGRLDLNCGRYKIQISREIYGRHPTDKCFPSSGGRDCSVEGRFFKNLCNGTTHCEHLGVSWRPINRPGCRDVYTNYVHLVYQCVDDTGISITRRVI